MEAKKTPTLNAIVVNDFGNMLVKRATLRNTSQAITNFALAGKLSFYAAVRALRNHGKVTCPMDNRPDTALTFKYAPSATFWPQDDGEAEQGIEELYEDPGFQSLSIMSPIDGVSWQSKAKLSEVCDNVTSLHASCKNIALLSPFANFCNVKHLKMGDVSTADLEEMVAQRHFMEKIESLELNLYIESDGFDPLMLLFPCLRDLNKLTVSVTDFYYNDFVVEDLADIQLMLDQLPSIKHAKFFFSGKSTTKTNASEFNDLFEAFKNMSFNGRVFIYVWLDCAGGLNIDNNLYKQDDYGDVYRELHCNGSQLRIDFNEGKNF